MSTPNTDTEVVHVTFPVDPSTFQEWANHQRPGYSVLRLTDSAKLAIPPHAVCETLPNDNGVRITGKIMVPGERALEAVTEIPKRRRRARVMAAITGRKAPILLNSAVQIPFGREMPDFGLDQ